LGELAVQQKNLDFMKSPDSPEKRKYLAEDGIPMEDHIDYLEDYMSQFQNIYDILKPLI
jgi:hypothetical protein